MALRPLLLASLVADAAAVAELEHGAFARGSSSVSSVRLGSSFPVGRWNGSMATAISGPPNSKLPDAPTLGNGYTGVMMGVGHLPGSVDLWLNSNSMWSCDNNTASAASPGHAHSNWGPGRLTPAVCSLVGLGGVSLSVQQKASSGHETLVAEQRIESGQLYTKQATDDGAIEMLTYMHPTENALVTDVTSTLPAGTMLDVVLWVYRAQRDTATGSNTSLLWASRDASKPCDDTKGCDESIKRIRTALAVRFHGTTAATPFDPTKTALNGTRYAGVGAHVALPGSGKTVSVITALADNLLEGNSHDPTSDATALAASSTATAISAAASSYWSKFWGSTSASISLPSSPAVEAYWRGALYATACMTPSTEVLAKYNGLAPPSGLYGPWVSSDSPAWNGDYTLDYNQEAQYYGVFSSNHEELASAYFPPITAWMDSAKQSAQAHAAKGGITCPANAMHFSCHLAPWGYQSHDQSEYMHWNGNFAALLFINHWEYTQNKTFAKEFAYPLLEGLNAWWGCYLTKTSKAGGGYVYNDFSTTDPDNEHEGQKVPNPQIGIALIRRSLSAQLDIAKAIGVTPEPIVADMLANLAPFNIADGHYTAYENATVKQSDGFAYYPLWPSEMVNALDGGDDTEIARHSVALYVGLGGIGVRPVLEFSAAVRAGAPAAVPKGCRLNCTVPAAVSGSGIVANFEKFLDGAQRGSFLPAAPGGGTENVGIVQAINDMLVQAPGGKFIALFPVWDRTQDASFSNLLVKGAIEVSASWSATKQAASGITILARKEHRGPVAIQLACQDVAVTCADGSSPMVRSSGDQTTFTAPPGVACKVVGNSGGC